MSDEIMVAQAADTGIAQKSVNVLDGIAQHVMEEGFYATFSTEDREGQKKLYKATNAADLLRSYMETPIEVVDFVFSGVQVTDEEGEIKDVLGVFLIDKDSRVYQSTSYGVLKSAGTIIKQFGEPSTWDEPLTVVCRETNTAKGRRYKYLDLI